MIKQVVFHHPFNAIPMPDIAMILFWLVLGIGMPVLFFIGKSYNPGAKRRFISALLSFSQVFSKNSAEDSEDYRVKTYRPIMEYGGWGIRYGKTGNAFNVSGNRGVELVFKESRSLMIGSQTPEKLAKAIKKLTGT